MDPQKPEPFFSPEKQGNSVPSPPSLGFHCEDNGIALYLRHPQLEFIQPLFLSDPLNSLQEIHGNCFSDGQAASSQRHRVLKMKNKN